MSVLGSAAMISCVVAWGRQQKTMSMLDQPSGPMSSSLDSTGRCCDERTRTHVSARKGT